MANNPIMGDISKAQAFQNEMKKRVVPDKKQKESILQTFKKAIESKRKALQGLGDQARALPKFLRIYFYKKIIGIKNYNEK